MQKAFCAHKPKKGSFYTQTPTGTKSQPLLPPGGGGKQEPPIAAGSAPGNSWILPTWNSPNLQWRGCRDGSDPAAAPGGDSPRGQRPEGGSWLFLSLWGRQGCPPSLPGSSSSALGEPKSIWISFLLHHRGQAWLSAVPTALGDPGDTNLPPLGQPELFAKCFGVLG